MASFVDAALAQLVETAMKGEQKFVTIRHKAFAHAGHLSPAQLQGVFAAVPVAVFEPLIVLPLPLYKTLRRWPFSPGCH